MIPKSSVVTSKGKPAKRHCCYIDPKTKKSCDQPAHWQIFPKDGIWLEDYTEACSDHVQDLKRDDDKVYKI